MTDYKKLVDALRCELHYTSCPETNCKYICHDTFCDTYRLMVDAAAAIEALNRLVDLNTERCEALRKQLREAHESYEKHLNELEAQLPKRGEMVEVVRCKDCKHRPTGTGVNHDIEFPDARCPCQCYEDYWYSWMPSDDWYCGNGEKMEVQDG